MNDFVTFLEEIKKRRGIKNDLQLGKFLGISQSNVYKIMDGRGVPGDETCIRIANAVGCDPGYVLMLARKAANKSPNAIAVWDRLLKSLPKQVFFYILAGGWSMVSGVTAAVSHCILC